MQPHSAEQTSIPTSGQRCTRYSESTHTHPRHDLLTRPICTAHDRAIPSLMIMCSSRFLATSIHAKDVQGPGHVRCRTPSGQISHPLPYAPYRAPNVQRGQRGMPTCTTVRVQTES
jgi:hypothetical protein